MNRDTLVLKYQKYQTSHILHLLLSVVTFGLWVPAWILVTLSNANERYRIEKQLEKLP